MAKDTIIRLRVTSEEKAAAEAVAEARDTTLSDMIRKHLARVVRQAQGKDALQ
jgi:antitoxin component of RelBE/YafQ-DinJ toxin-antitoxin module